MKLLLDQNLSPKLVGKLAELFPGSAHVFDFSLDQASDDALWDFAKANGFTIVSKDEDFNLLSLRRGSPPQVIWLLMGNCSTADVENAIRAQQDAVLAFEADPNNGTLVIR